LHPYIVFRIAGHPDVRFGEDGRAVGFDFADEEHVLRLAERKLSVRVEIDWKSIDLPPLPGKKLKKSETYFFPSGSEEPDELAYGPNDVENGTVGCP
jgi:hypothetical protein